MTENMRRFPNAGDVEEILCGTLPQDMSEDAQAQRRIIKQFEINHPEFISMVETILSTKENDTSRAVNSCWLANWMTGKYVNSRAVDFGRPGKDRKRSRKYC